MTLITGCIPTHEYETTPKKHQRQILVTTGGVSDDLDFTLLEERGFMNVKEAITNASEKAREESGISFESDIGLKENINGFEGISKFRMLRLLLIFIHVYIFLISAIYSLLEE